MPRKEYKHLWRRYNKTNPKHPVPLQNWHPRSFCTTNEHPGRRECAGRKRRTENEKCHLLAMVGSDFCKHHGGHAGRGIKSSKFMSGKYTKELRTRDGSSKLAADYQRSLEDARLVELRDDIAVLEARERELLSRASEDSTAKESSARWKMIDQTWTEFRNAQAKGDERRVLFCLERLDALINKGAYEFGLWDDIQRLVLTKEKLIAAQRKAEAESELYWPIDRVMALVAYVATAARETITDAETLNSFQRKLAQATTSSVSGVADAAGAAQKRLEA